MLSSHDTFWKEVLKMRKVRVNRASVALWARLSGVLLTGLMTLAVLPAQRLYWLGTLTETGGVSYAYGVSNDGLTVVGHANGSAVVWNRAANTIIVVLQGSDSRLWAVSADGSVAVGNTYPDPVGGPERAFMWTRQNGFQWLPPAPGTFCWTADITPSGRYAVGKSRAGDNLPTLWDLSQNPPVRRAYAPQGMWLGDAYGISDDGRIIAGFGHGSGWGFRGIVIGLRDDFSVAWSRILAPASGHSSCVARGLSADGAVVVGTSVASWFSVYYPAMWRAANNWNPELLAHLGGSAGVAYDIRGDVIVGFCRNASGQNRAVRWRLATATTQVEDLNQTYASLLTDGSRLEVAWRLSANGRYIVGWGYHAPKNRTEAFLLDTEASSTRGDVNGDGCVDDADLLEVLFAVGGGSGIEDLNGDGVVDDADLLEVLFNFGSGC